MMVATDKLSILRINWEGTEERDYSLDLRRIPFSINQQVHYGKQKMFLIHNHILLFCITRINAIDSKFNYCAEEIIIHCSEYIFFFLLMNYV